MYISRIEFHHFHVFFVWLIVPRGIGRSLVNSDSAHDSMDDRRN